MLIKYRNAGGKYIKGSELTSLLIHINTILWKGKRVHEETFCGQLWLSIYHYSQFAGILHKIFEISDMESLF